MAFATLYAVQIRRNIPETRMPEYLMPTDRDNPALWNRSTGLTRAAAPGSYAISNVSRVGAHEYIVVLVEFKDREFTLKERSALMERYERMFNSFNSPDNSSYSHNGVTFYGATGSVAEYFKDQSYGKFLPSFKIIGPITPSKGWAYYGKGTQDSGVSELVREVCDSIMSQGVVNLTEYATHGNIEHLSFIYAGNGENYEGADVDAIWPQASMIMYNRHGIGYIKYACTCELFWDSESIPDGIGTFCHEFSHTLGLPDYYNTSSSQISSDNAAMGYWSIMDYGNYENQGFSPVGYTAFEKYSLGWMEPKEIEYAGTYALHDISIEPDHQSDLHTAYRISTGDDNTFILLENHLKKGWYKYHAAQGLMVTAVSYNSNSWFDNSVNNGNGHKRYGLLAADDDYGRNTGYGDLFPYNSINSITTTGKPELSIGSVYPPYSIYNISLDNDIVTFQALPDMPSGIKEGESQDITIEITEGVLSIYAPIGSSISVHDISGKCIIQSTAQAPVTKIELAEHGLWIVKCDSITRKVRN